MPAGRNAPRDWPAVPLLSGVRDLARAGHVTGASGRNWASYGADVTLSDALPPEERAILTDPQTSGGLLVACAPDQAEAALAIFRDHGFAEAAVIGRAAPGPGRLVVA